MSINFESLGLSEPLLRALSERGYTEPTPIQAQAIPAVLGGGDLLAGAQTGTGKTAGFTLPILQRLSTMKPADRLVNGRRVIRALVLTPTRELAAQVEESVRAYGKYLSFRSMVIYGGVGIHPQIKQLRDGVDILVATPGRLLDHVEQRTVDLSKVEILVLDEADRMLDMGFIRDIKRILNLLPRQRQNLLFSATFSDEIRALADDLLNQPELIEVARRNATAENITQRVLMVGRDRKRELLSHMVKEHNWYQVLVFTRTKHGANRLGEQLERDGITAAAIHGNKSQAARTRALADFKAGKLQVLVATDIAARGIDIVDLPHVVNYELPNVAEDYVHRIGRTGRAGADGEALSLVCIDELGFLNGIERLIKRQLPREIVPGFELDPNDRAVPIELGRGRMLNGNGGGGRGGPRGAGAGASRGHAPSGRSGPPRGNGAPAGRGGFDDRRGPAPRASEGGFGGQPRPQGARHSESAPRHDGAPRSAGAPRPGGAPRSNGAPRPGGSFGANAGQRRSFGPKR